jgi:hypothetical protein
MLGYTTKEFTAFILGAITLLLLLGRAHGQDVASLSVRGLPTPIMSTAKVHSPGPAFVDWVPQNVVWSDHLLKSTAKQCAQWIDKYDSRYRVDHDSIHDFADCQVQLFDSIGRFRWLMNANPALRSAKRRDALRVYVSMSYGTNRHWGAYSYDELTGAVKAVPTK